MATNIALDGNFQFPSTTQPRLSHFSHVRLHASLWTIARQAPLSMEFSRQACWSGLPCPPAGNGPNPGIKPRSPALEGEFFTTDPPEKPPTTSPAQPCLILQAYLIAQLLSHVRLFVTPWTRFLCHPLSPGVCSNSYPLSQWCYLTISSSVTLISFCLQSFPASGSFPMRRFFPPGSQSNGASVSE